MIWCRRIDPRGRAPSPRSCWRVSPDFRGARAPPPSCHAPRSNTLAEQGDLKIRITNLHLLSKTVFKWSEIEFELESDVLVKPIQCKGRVTLSSDNCSQNRNSHSLNGKVILRRIKGIVKTGGPTMQGLSKVHRVPLLKSRNYQISTKKLLVLRCNQTF